MRTQPCAAVNQTPDGSPTNAVLTTEVGLANTGMDGRTDRIHIRSGQFGADIPRAVAWVTTTLNLSIGRIVGIGAQPEVRGPDAGRVIAAVQDMQTRRDRAVGQAPRFAMGEMDRAAPFDDTVAVVIPVSLPRPTFRGTIGAGPETFAKIAAHRGVPPSVSWGRTFARRGPSLLPFILAGGHADS